MVRLWGIPGESPDIMPMSGMALMWFGVELSLDLKYASMELFLGNWMNEGDQKEGKKAAVASL